MNLLFFLLLGFFAGSVAKFIHPQDAPAGFLPTIGIGIAGSFMGGAIDWILGLGVSPLESSGFFMSILGAVIFLVIWRWWVLKNDSAGPRHFLTGKRL